VAETPLYVGIDLGTTNSAAAVFDGERVSVVRNAQGATVTPSVVRLDKQARVTVGTRARRFTSRGHTKATCSIFLARMASRGPIER
jgi:molecular chaperone DnaK